MIPVATGLTTYLLVPQTGQVLPAPNTNWCVRLLFSLKLFPNKLQIQNQTR
ncbi:hypothetical protein MiSe_01450 [Microseira wollei NIES-4236]|uniref:Uncharacterized protein n=1 Tax=Microseira wollei NIES-4236 TaxID=2530354 RepID=A0AAV3X0K3_9CYAN|nr:hypothetical protein MiSe_01450 [Microseira wollei NIES-4236]